MRIESWVLSEHEDATIRHNVFVNRFAGGLTNNLAPLIALIKRDTIARVLKNGPDKTVKSKRSLDALIRDTKEIQARHYTGHNAELLAELRAFTGHEEGFEERLLSKAGQEQVAKTAAMWGEVLASPMVLEANKVSSLLKPFVKDWSKAEISRVSQLIKFGVDQGITNHEIAASIGQNFDKRTKANHKAIIRTAVNHTSTTARMKVDEANKDISIGYQITAVLDGRTSPFCSGIDGTIVKWSDSVRPMPPFHPNCRTITVTLLEDEPLEEKTYYQWLKGQGKTKGGRDFVKEVLGKDRGKLFLDGGLSSERFKKLTTDELFQPITLDQLKKKDSLSNAFDKAGI